MGVPAFHRILRSLPINKAVLLLRFLTDKDTIHTSLRASWLTLFDASHVDSVLLATLDSHFSQLSTVLSTFVEKFEGRAQTTAPKMSQSRKSTAPSPPAISRPRMVPLPEPEQLTVGFIAGDVPPSRAPQYVEQAMEKSMSGRKSVSFLHPSRAAKNKTEIETLKKTAKRPELKSEQRAIARQKWREELQMKQSEETEVVEKKKRPMKKMEEVRMNTAAILREDALYKKKQQDDARLLREYEECLRDASEFHSWQTEMMAKEEAERLAAVGERKLEIELSQLRAQEAREKNEQEHIREARQWRAEMTTLLAEQEADEESNAKARRETAEKLKENCIAGVEKARAEVLDGKTESASQMKSERKDIELTVAQMMEEERQRKEELIRQIRAAERVPRASQVKVYDPTESSGIGLLDEMSLAELHERLAVLKERNEREVNERRQLIMEEKAHRVADIRKRAESISHFRGEARREAQEEREARRLAMEHAAAKVTTERAVRIEDLSAKLEEKRMAREKAKAAVLASEKSRRVDAQFRSADRAAMEARHFSHVERGQRREAYAMQTAQKLSAEKDVHLREKSDLQRTRNVSRNNALKRKELGQSEADVMAARALQLKSQKEETLRMSKNVRGERVRHLKGDTAQLLRDLEARLAPSQYEEEVRYSLDS